jgi:hypothetical protein
MTRFFEHTAAAIVAVLIMTVTFNAIVTVPAEPAADAAAPILA